MWVKQQSEVKPGKVNVGVAYAVVNSIVNQFD